MMLDWGTKNKILVLCYHNVGPQTGIRFLESRSLTVTQAQFKRQIQWLSRILNFVTPEQLLRGGSKSKLPPRATLLTFDDGTRGLIDYALPVLNQLGLQSICFAAPMHHSQPRPYWWDLADRAYSAATSQGLSFMDYLMRLRQAGCVALDGDPELQKHAGEVQSHLWPMNEAELKRWTHSGQWLGSHALTHDPVGIWKDEEMSDPTQIQELAGTRYFPALALPYGELPKPNQAAELYRTWRRQGYSAVFSTQGAMALLPPSGEVSDILPRLVVPSQWSLPRLVAKIAHLSLKA